MDSFKSNEILDNDKYITANWLSKLRMEMHYPECWDTAAYPTIWSALYEMAACSGCAAKRKNGDPSEGGKWSKTPEAMMRESVSQERMYKYLKAILITDERGQGVGFEEAMDEAAEICNLIEEKPKQKSVEDVAKHKFDTSDYALIGTHPARAQESVNSQLAALKEFKDYVHKRLDDAGIPTHPDGKHSKHGCRIGDRLDIALKREISDVLEVRAGLAGIVALAGNPKF